MHSGRRDLCHDAGLDAEPASSVFRCSSFVKANGGGSRGGGRSAAVPLKDLPSTVPLVEVVRGVPRSYR